MEYCYYPGCTLRTTAKRLDLFARESARKLGITLTEPEEWQCCGGVYPQARDEIATRLGAIRVLAEARDRGQEVLTVCSACHHVLKRVNADLEEDSEFADRANAYLQLPVPYRGETTVVHFLEVLRDRIGFEQLKSKITVPLSGRRIAPYYGCLLLRPGQVMALDDPENPRVLEELLLALGAEPISSPFRNECCGAYVQLEKPEAAKRAATRVIESAGRLGAEAMITACPLCRYNLSQTAKTLQEETRRAKGAAGAEAMPVYYFTELLGEALGVELEE